MDTPDVNPDEPVSSTAPARVDPPTRGTERELLEAWLDYHRATLLAKCARLTGEQLSRRSVPPSTLSLLGLVRHLTEVERHWLRVMLHGEDLPGIYWTEAEPDGDFDGATAGGAEADLATYRSEVETCRRAAAAVTDLDAVGIRTRGGEGVSLRWILGHLVEEYARHNGHADLLRQAIDGATGE